MRRLWRISFFSLIPPVRGEMFSLYERSSRKLQDRLSKFKSNFLFSNLSMRKSQSTNSEDITKNVIIVGNRFWKVKSILYVITSFTALVVITQVLRTSSSRNRNQVDQTSKLKALPLQLNYILSIGGIFTWCDDAAQNLMCNFLIPQIFFIAHEPEFPIIETNVSTSNNENIVSIIHKGNYDLTYYPLSSEVMKILGRPVYEILPVHKIKNVYSDIEKRIINKRIKIKGIFRIANPSLECSFDMKKMQKQKDYPNLEEIELFHGTKRIHVDSICMNNFNWRFHGKEVVNKFGKGVCFTTNSMYASNYSDKDNNDKVMFIAKVLIGKKCLGTKLMNLPPEGFDTTTNKGNDDIVVVKYEDNEFYPKYMIKYHLLPECVKKSVNENIVPVLHKQKGNYDLTYFPHSSEVMKILGTTVYETLPIHRIENVHLDIQKRIINKRIKIQSIFKIDNTSLECSYEMKKMQKRNNYPDLEEVELFHGTKRIHVDSICMNNFNWRFHGKEVGNKFGKGVCFTSNAMYATNYSDKDNDEKVMFIAKVLVGKKCLGTKVMNLPPEDFDTTTNKGNDNIVVVKYEDNEFYPKYMIRYKVLPEHKEMCKKNNSVMLLSCENCI